MRDALVVNRPEHRAQGALLQGGSVGYMTSGPCRGRASASTIGDGGTGRQGVFAPATVLRGYPGFFPVNTIKGLTCAVAHWFPQLSWRWRALP